jgi:hypothetical protein
MKLTTALHTPLVVVHVQSNQMEKMQKSGAITASAWKGRREP